MSVYSATLNGKKKFKDIDGSWTHWGGGWIDTLYPWDDSGSPLDGTWKLTGKNWRIEQLQIAAADGGGARITDLNGKSGRVIEKLELGVDSVVDVQSTRIDVIIGWSGVQNHSVSLGDARVDTIRLDGKSNTVVSGSEFVDLIDTGGRATITIRDGGAGLVKTDDNADKLTVQDGFVQIARMREGKDEVVVKSGGGIGTLDTGRGKDEVTVRNGHVNYLQTGDGKDEVTARNGANIRSAYLENGND